MTFYLHRSNALEHLAARLAELVSSPAGPPTEPELIAVQSRGMERWLSQELARRLGIWAHGEFLFPRNLVERILTRVLPPEPEGALAFSQEHLTWAVAAALPELLEGPAFASLSGYLRGDASGLRLLQLSRRLADLFDQYVVYRPELVLRWERDPGDDWQAQLWHRLARAGVGGHVAGRAARCLERLAAPAPDLSGLPARLCLFGISTLPPLYLRVLSALATHRDVHLLQLSPCREYWADVRPLPRSAPAQAQAPVEGNGLLASLGRLGRDFQSVLEDEADYREAPGDLYRDPAEGESTGSMLAWLQSDILHLRRRAVAPWADEVGALPLAPSDRSVAVHSCHGAMRELEVLRDQLLAAFEQDPTLEARDVIVMTPDLTAYAPYIDAVFGAAEQPVPYAVADRSFREENAVAEALLAVLDAIGGRLTAPAVVDLLGHAAVGQRFGLGPADLEVVRGWVAEAAICWGVDAAHRAELDQPAYEENTWRFGLNRLLLGHALPPDGRTLFAGTSPCAGVEGDDAQTLGRFAELAETLFELRERLRGPRPVGAWRDGLLTLLDRTVSATEQPLEHQAVRASLDALAARAAAAGFEREVSLDAIRDELERAFGEVGASAGFLSGGVTFCALLPMRSIPFRVVVLLGMNDDTFPRRQHRFGFDRIAERPRPGDRSTRDDDRYQFLECVLAARERLIITYVGQDVRDNSRSPPSVVVSELLDRLGESFLPAGLAPAADDPLARERVQQAVWAQVVTEHPLQPFDPRYFDGRDPERLFSYDATYAAGARASLGERQPPAPFVSRLAPPEPITEVELEELVRFFGNPARGLLRRQLGLQLGADVTELSEREPQVLDALTRYQIGVQLLAEGLAGRDPAALYPVVAADGVLPLGAGGRIAFTSLLPGVEAVRHTVASHLEGEALPAARVELHVGAIRLCGWLGQLWPPARIDCRLGSVRATDLIATWIRHLALCAGRPEGVAPRSVFVGRAEKRSERAAVRVFERLEPDDARHLLAELLSLYTEGQQVALRFFPEPSLACAKALRGEDPEDPRARSRAVASARVGFDSNPPHRAGADADPYVRRAFAGVADVLGQPFPGPEDDRLGFVTVALRVLGPLLECLGRAG